MAETTDFRSRLEEGNAEFRKTTDPLLLKMLSSKHAPWVAIVSCADARVCPGRLFNLSTGDSFDVRVAGNSASEGSALASLEYAVEHLGVRAVVVLGHTQCGAARAAVEGERDGHLGVITGDMARAREMLPQDRRDNPDDVAEGNVKLQLRLLQDNSVVIRDAVCSGRLILMGAMLELSTGRVRFI